MVGFSAKGRSQSDNVRGCIWKNCNLLREPSISNILQKFSKERVGTGTRTEQHEGQTQILHEVLRTKRCPKAQTLKRPRLPKCQNPEAEDPTENDVRERSKHVETTKYQERRILPWPIEEMTAITMSMSMCPQQMSPPPAMANSRNKNYISEDPKQYWYRLNSLATKGALKGARHRAARPTLPSGPKFCSEERTPNASAWGLQ